VGCAQPHPTLLCGRKAVGKESTYEKTCYEVRRAGGVCVVVRRMRLNQCLGRGNLLPLVTAVPPTATLPPAGTVSATISLPSQSQLYSIAVTDTAVWVHAVDAGTVLRIDPQTNRVVATIHVGHGWGEVAREGGFVWVLNRLDSTVSKIDTQTNRVVATISLPPPNGHLAVSPGAIWVSSLSNNVVRRIDPETNKVVASIPISDGPAEMSYGAGSLWVCGWNGAVWRLNPATNQSITRVDIGVVLGHLCAGISALDNTIWVEIFEGENNSGTLVNRVDPAANTLGKFYGLPDNLNEGIVADTQGGWVYDPQTGLYRIDPRTNQAVAALPMTNGGGVALGDGSVWLATSNGSLLRITPAS
jgi:YVTN family beta-propeller protein